MGQPGEPPPTSALCAAAPIPPSASPEQRHQVEEERLGGLSQLQLLGGHQRKGAQPGSRNQAQNQPPLRRGSPRPAEEAG